MKYLLRWNCSNISSFIFIHMCLLLSSCVSVYPSWWGRYWSQHQPPTSTHHHRGPWHHSKETPNCIQMGGRRKERQYLRKLWWMEVKDTTRQKVSPVVLVFFRITCDAEKTHVSCLIVKWIIISPWFCNCFRVLASKISRLSYKHTSNR